jgi:hypothetical protein
MQPVSRSVKFSLQLKKIEWVLKSPFRPTPTRVPNQTHAGWENTCGNKHLASLDTLVSLTHESGTPPSP